MADRPERTETPTSRPTTNLALYRRYRPSSFSEVIGQEHVTEPLMRALENGRLNHAFLFSGPRGCGKTSSARILARSLNCEQGPTPQPCGECESCVALAPNGSGSLDVIEIDAASHNGVEDARDLRERAFFAPVSSRFKIYIIDEAHMVTTAAFNALLKLVEEPPDFVKFVFATTEPDKVLQTIRSRTHHYPFRLIPPQQLREHLERICTAEGVAIEPTVLPLVVRAGGGSARDSLSVLDQLLAGAGPEGVTYARAVGLLGVTDAALLDEICEALGAADGAGVFRAVDRVVEAGHDPRRFAADLLERLRDLIVIDRVPDAAANGLITAPPESVERLTGQAIRLGPASLSRMADIVHDGLVQMRGTTSPRLVLELVCARMLLPAGDDGHAGVLQRIERLERRMEIAAEAGSPAAIPGAAPPAAAPAAQAAAPAPAVPAPAVSPATVPAPEAEVPGIEPGPPASSTSTPGSDAVASADAGPAGGVGTADSGPSGAPGSSDAPESASTGSEPPAPGPTEGAVPAAVPAESAAAPPAAAPPSAATQPPAAAPPTPAAPTAPADVVPPAAAASPVAGGVDVTAVRRVWDQVMDRVKGIRRAHWSALLDSTPATVEGDLLTITVKNRGNAARLSQNDAVETVSGILSALLGVRWRLRYVPPDGGGAASSGAARQPAQRPNPAPPAAGSSGGGAGAGASGGGASGGGASADAGGWPEVRQVPGAPGSAPTPTAPDAASADSPSAGPTPAGSNSVGPTSAGASAAGGIAAGTSASGPAMSDAAVSHGAASGVAANPASAGSAVPTSTGPGSPGPNSVGPNSAGSSGPGTSVTGPGSAVPTSAGSHPAVAGSSAGAGMPGTTASGPISGPAPGSVPGSGGGGVNGAGGSPAGGTAAVPPRGAPIDDREPPPDPDEEPPPDPYDDPYRASYDDAYDTSTAPPKADAMRSALAAVRALGAIEIKD